MTMLNSLSSSLKTLNMFCFADDCKTNPFVNSSKIAFPLDSLPHLNVRTIAISANLLKGGILPGSAASRDLESLCIWHSPLRDTFNWTESLDNMISAGTIGNLRKLSIGYMVQNARFYRRVFAGHGNRLQVLEAPLDDEQIRIVFHELKDCLQDLVVYTEGRLSDEGITGNPIMVEDDTQWDPRDGRQFPFIGDMKSKMLDHSCVYNILRL